MDHYWGRKILKKFEDAVKKDMGIFLNGPVYSRICVEVTEIDGNNNIEISLNENIYLPIAGKQLEILKRDANNNDTSLEGYVDSLNSILDDERNFR